MKLQDLIFEFATSTDGIDQFINELEVTLEYAREAKRIVENLNGKEVTVELTLNKTAQVNEPNCAVMLDSESLTGELAPAMDKELRKISRRYAGPGMYLAGKKIL